MTLFTPFDIVNAVDVVNHPTAKQLFGWLQSSMRAHNTKTANPLMSSLSVPLLHHSSVTFQDRTFHHVMGVAIERGGRTHRIVSNKVDSIEDTQKLESNNNGKTRSDSDNMVVVVRPKWRLATEKCVDASPLVTIIHSNQLMFIGSHSGLVACVDIVSG
jgi:hypothetical protein